MKTLVTGGEGFIGRHLVLRLLERGEEVVVLDALVDQAHLGRSYVLEPFRHDLIVANCGFRNPVKRALDGVDRVVHLAALVGVGQSMYEIERYMYFNTSATAMFLEALIESKVEKLVVASSMSIYGEGMKAEESWKRGTPTLTPEWKKLEPASVYAISKRDQEELCLVVGDAYGIPTTALRFFNVYGPGQSLSNPYTGVAGIFASRFLEGKQPLIYEDGLQTRDFIHVEDIVDGIILALESDKAAGYAINLCTGVSTTINQVAELIAEGLGKKSKPDYHPMPRKGDVRHCVGDPTLAYDLLDFQASKRVDVELPKLAQEWANHAPSIHASVEYAHTELHRKGLV